MKKPNITYKFIPHGQSYVPADKKSEIVLDVGGQNKDNELIFDHHFPKGPTDCTALLVYNNNNPREPLKNLYENRNKDNIENFTIVLHRDPDFDCACAAWLVKNFLEHGVFPEGADWLAEYASRVDSGALHIRKEFYFVPASAMYAFSESAQKFTSDKRDNWILERAFELMDWCAKNLAEVKITVDDDGKIFDLMTKANIFSLEHYLVKEDRPKYDKEIGDNSKTQKIDNFQLFNKKTLIPYGERALLYFHPPESVLTKYWARSEGFHLTLIPMPCNDKWKDAVWKPTGFTGKPNRVIISVPPESTYTLQPLAMQLERAECEVERKILGDSAELKRTRTLVRKGYENEEWVTNNDPWFDGSSHNNTIVDSPSSLSFLSTERIISIALNHTVEDVSNARINIICPISLNNDNNTNVETWEDLIKQSNIPEGKIENIWEKISETPCPKPNLDRLKYALFPSVNDFLSIEYSEKEKIVYNKQDTTDLDRFLDTLNSWFPSLNKLLNFFYSKQERTLWYQKLWDQAKVDIVLAEKTDEIEFKITEKINQTEKTDQIPSPNIKIEKIRMVCFTSKIGFVIIPVDFVNIKSNWIPKILRGINKSYPEILSSFSHNLKQLAIGKRPVFMVFAEFNGEKINNLDIGQDVFNACSFLDETTSFTDGSSERSRMEKMLLRINAGTVFGFSRNCTIFASITRKNLSGGIVKQSEFIHAFDLRFNGPWLNAWILVMHQQLFMHCMKTKFGLAENQMRNRLSKLRSELVKFTANSCFIQVTSDPLGAELYNRWKKLLTIDDLNKEVSSQIEALNNNATSSIQSMLEFIGWIFFPVSIVVSILSLIDSNKIFFIEESVKISILAVLIGVIIVWIIFITEIYKKIGSFSGKLVIKLISTRKK